MTPAKYQRAVNMLVLCVWRGRAETALLYGVRERTVSNTLGELYREIGAKHMAHAVWLLWPKIAHRLPYYGPDRRMRS